MSSGHGWLYFCHHEKEPCVNNEKRPDGMTVVQQQGMEVLGVNLSPSVSFKDRFTVRPHVMLNACLSLSWPDNLFRPRSQVAQLRPNCPRSESAHSGGSKDVWRANGVSPRVGSSPDLPGRLVESLRVRR